MPSIKPENDFGKRFGRMTPGTSSKNRKKFWGKLLEENYFTTEQVAKKIGVNEKVLVNLIERNGSSPLIFQYLNKKYLPKKLVEKNLQKWKEDLS